LAKTKPADARGLAPAGKTKTVNARGLLPARTIKTVDGGNDLKGLRKLCQCRSCLGNFFFPSRFVSFLAFESVVLPLPLFLYSLFFYLLGVCEHFFGLFI
jgi:hypothetical protein